MKMRILCLISLLLFLGMLGAAGGETRKTGKGKPMCGISENEKNWAKKLTPEQYHVLRLKGTEPPFTGELLGEKREGAYLCAACGAALFNSESKFDSGTGWPSFWAPAAEDSVRTAEDHSHGMRRAEVLCSKCEGHLGHVFDDGPRPTGKRYCINSVSLKFEERKTAGSDSLRGAVPAGLETATFAAGCFWGVEESFRTLEGVQSTEVGYTGGRTREPTYKQVCTGKTGHAEAVRIVYDPEKISYRELLKIFWNAHDPTTPDRQGPDVGEQYRSAVFFHSPQQKEAAEQVKDELERSGKWMRPVVTQIVPAKEFWKAEEYHQQYLKKQGKAFCRIPGS